MRVKFAVLVLVLAVGVSCAACASSTSQAPAAIASSEPPAESVQPSPKVETAWFWSDSNKEAPMFRSLAFVDNSGSQPLRGVQLEWVAYDANNSIVGSYKGAIADIPPGAKVPYVAGAGLANLSGIPARVEFRVVKKGSFVDTAAQAFKTADVTFEKSEFNMYPGAKGAYDVTAKVTTGPEEVASANIGGIVILKDQAGAVVGGDFWMPENLPETVPPGTTFTMQFGMTVVTGEPVSAEVFSTQEP